MRRGVLVPLIAITQLVGPSPPSWACTCALPGNVYTEYAASHAVFLGEVVEISFEAPPRSSFDPVQVTIHVEESWKGAPGDTVRVVTAASGASCGFTFQVGTRYLVYAGAYGDGSAQLATSLCSRTHTTWPGDPEVELLDSIHRIPMHLAVTPNPTRGQVFVDWAILQDAGRDAAARIDVLDSQGRRVRTLVDNEPDAAGRHRTYWDWRDEAGRPASAGVYWVRLAYAGRVLSRRVVKLGQPWRP